MNSAATESQQVTLEPNERVVIHANPESTICVVGKDTLVVSIMSRSGELIVRLDQQGQELWTHTFTYTLPLAQQTEPVPAPPPPPDMPMRRPRGRPRMNVPRQRLTVDGETV